MSPPLPGSSATSRIILIFGAAAGLIVAVPMCLLMANAEPGSAATSHFTGYLIMLLALSLILGVGMSWAIVRQRLTGPASVDDIDDED